MTIALTASNVTVRFGSTIALRRVSASCARGATTVILGPNGAGKTTLLRCLVGSLRPDEGNVTLPGGERVHALSPAKLARHVAFHGQSRPMRTDLTVRQIVELGQFAVGRSIERVESVLDAFDLAGAAEQAFRTLSAGNQQRALLARAVAQLQADGVLVLDEPFATLDVAHVQRVVQVIRELRDDGQSIILTTHRFDLAHALADDVWLMRDGGIVAAGTASEVLRPERLDVVFGVPFQRVTTPSGAEWWQPASTSAAP
ncbi:MAG: ABC transporter ATP-binding protein [Planctomycetota bacterium]